MIRKFDPRAKFLIVGSNPTEQVKQLAQAERVVVTGRVPDMRPYLRFATVSVAPLRAARGVQNQQIGFEAGMFRRAGAAQQTLCEESMPGVFGDDANADSILRVGTRKAVDDE